MHTNTRECISVFCVTIDLIMHSLRPQRPPGIFSVLDDICFQMHGQSEGADIKLLEVSTYVGLYFELVHLTRLQHSLSHTLDRWEACATCAYWVDHTQVHVVQW